MSHYRIPILGGLAWSDCWDGYPVSRERFLNALKTYQTPNPIVFGGDIHQNWVSHVKQGNYQLPEFVMTSLTTSSLGSVTAQEMKALAPDCLYTDRHRRGYGLVNLTHDAMQVDLRGLESVVKPQSSIETLQRFTVKNGAHHIVPSAV